MANFLIGTAISLGVSAIASLFAPQRSQTVVKGKQEQFTQPRASYGDFIPQVWGKGRVAAILAWATFPPTEKVSKKKSRSGGKGGGGQSTTTKTYSYWGNCAFIVGTKLTQIHEIRLNSKLVWKGGSFSKLLEGKGCSIRIYLGTANQGFDSLIQAKLGDKAIPYRHRSVIVFENLPLEEFGNQYPQCSVIVQNGTPSLGAVIKDLCLQSPYLNEADLEVGDLNGILVTGFQVDREMTIAEKLTALQRCYFFDVIDQGTKLRFQRQYRPSSAAYIPPNQLAAHEEGQERPGLYRETQGDPNELPTQYEIKYLDANNNLLPGLARSPIYPRATHLNVQTIDYPGTLTEEEARTIATRNLWLDWVRSLSQEFSLPPKYWNLEPGDVIEADIGGNRQQFQVRSLEFGANYQLLVKTHAYNPNLYGFTYTANATYSAPNATATQGQPINVGRAIAGNVVVTDGVATYEEGVDYTVNYATGTVTPVVGGGITNGTTVQISYEAPQEPQNSQLPAVSDTDLRVLELPLIYDDDPYCLYVFGDGDSNWSKAGVYISRDAGNTYSYAADLETRSVFGSVDTTLTSASGLDTLNTVDVTVPDHAELESISTELFEQGENRALVGDEILDFRDATLLGASNGFRQYRLAHLNRGLRGTATTHTSNEQFYLLSDYHLKLEGRSDDIGRTLYFKALSPGQTLDEVDPVTVTVQGLAYSSRPTSRQYLTITDLETIRFGI